MIARLLRLLFICGATITATTIPYSSPALAVSFDEVIPVDPGGQYTTNPEPGLNYVVDRMEGVITSFGGNPRDGFSFSFNNTIGPANYTYTYTLYGTNGPLTTMMSNSYIIGPSGSVWFTVPSVYQNVMVSIAVSITLISQGGNIGDFGNTHAHSP